MRFAGARYSASRVPVSCSLRTQYPMSQSIRETTMNVFEPIIMYSRKSSAVKGWAGSRFVYVEKFFAANDSDPATALPSRIGRPAKITGMIDSRRTAPLYRVMILIRARKTLQTTPREPLSPGRPRPNPFETVSAATAPHRLLAGDSRVDRERAARLRDEDVLEGDLLRPDLLDRRPVPRHGLDDPRQDCAGVLDHHAELRAPAVLRGDRDIENPRHRPEAGHRGIREDPLEAHDVLVG